MSDTPRTDQLNNGLLSACQESAIYNFMLNHARTLERELNAAKAENADNLALIKRMHRAITARMSADNPTDAERFELMQVWKTARETIDKANS